MIKQIGILVASAALTACWGAPPDEKILNGLCVDLLTGDAEIVGDLTREAGTTIEPFCACYASKMIEDDAKLVLHKDAIFEMVTVRKEEGLGVEDAAKRVQELIEAGEIDAFDARQLDSTGRDYQDISEAIGENGGTCPA